MKKMIFVFVLVAVLMLGGFSAYAIQGLDEDESTRILANDGYATLTTDKVGGTVTTTKDILLNDVNAAKNGLHVTDTYSVFSMDAAFVKSLAEQVSGETVTFSVSYDSTKTKVTFAIIDGGAEVFAKDGRCVGELPYTLGEGDPINVAVLDGKNAPVGISGYFPDANLVRWQLSGCGTYSVAVRDTSFSDVPDSHWANIYVEYLASKGVINGMGNGTFAPEAPLTRAQFVTLLAMMSGDDISGGTDQFTDVKKEHWYYEEVSWAAKAGVTNGVGGGLFAPENKITREEVASMVLNFFNYMGVAPTPIRTATTFTDSADMADWSAQKVPVCQEVGVISGFPDGTFRPKANATRAEAATMCSRMVSYFLVMPQ
ncbi:MAG: S-layer homology domain-containing protein [Firmicutes bacterium]|nr:S-layer homology domain-containing protein [Bacillota bacterium]